MTKLQERAAIAVLIILHLVGLTGLNIPRFERDFVPLIWVNLVFLFCIVLSLHSKWNPAFGYFVGGVFILGMAVEIIGVRTHAIFGAYAYSGQLGQSLFGVPLVIGLNWVTLTYCAGFLARKVDPALGIRVVSGALLMVGMDALLEPFAIRFDLWQWEGGHPPLRNYLGWFATALVAQLAYHLLLAKTLNPVATRTYFILALFFAANLAIDRWLV
jgi:putative membrane protein